MVYTDFNSETGECLPKIRVLIADDHELIRQTLRDLLEKEPAMVVIGEARDEEQAVALASKLKPDVVNINVISVVD